MAHVEATLTDSAWAALVAGDPDAADEPRPTVAGRPELLPSRLAVQEAAVAAVSVALMAAAALGRDGVGGSGGAALDRGHVAAAVRSERFFSRGDGSTGAGFAPLSRFWPTADGWVRTHANYPWHRAALLRALDTPAEAEAVAAALARLRSAEVEERVFGAGGVAGAVRTADEWRAHPQGAAVADEPLVSHTVLGPARGRPRRGRGPLPAAGVRVLDLTRVIAGPVCTRYLAALGASVLRLDPPGHPDLRSGALADTLLGKASALVDLASDEGRATAERLLGEADVVVCGYRPGALSRLGLDPEALAQRHPGLVIVQLAAWGHQGPWSGHRGFDSVVQGPTGIASAEAGDGAEPGALPCQLLDHGTGYLAAAAALDGLRRQRQVGGTHLRRVSLARTAHWLLSAPPPPAPQDPTPPPDLRQATAGAADAEPARAGRARPEPVPAGSDVGPPPEVWTAPVAGAPAGVEAVTPPGSLAGEPLRWPGITSGYGRDPAAWPSGAATR